MIDEIALSKKINEKTDEVVSFILTTVSGPGWAPQFRAIFLAVIARKLDRLAAEAELAARLPLDQTRRRG